MPLLAVREPSVTSAAPVPAVPRRNQLDILIDAAYISDQRRYGIEALCDFLGARISFECSGDPDIYYGTDARIGERAAAWITPEPWPLAPARIQVIDGCPLVIHRLRPVSLIRNNCIQFDIALATYHWLSLKSEDGLARDEHSRVRGSNHPASLGTSGIPLIHRYANLLCERLHAAGWRSECPRWPEGKTWAIAFTHDVDDPEIPVSAMRLMRGWIGTARGLRQRYWLARKYLNWKFLREHLVAAPERRRAWDFEQFRECERSASIRSAFYFGTHHAHENDVRYNLTARRYSEILNRLIGEGCEVGLHAAYETAQQRPAITEQLNRLSVRCKSPVPGVRYHYLQLDSTDPLGTLHDAAEGGLTYDTTIGFNDSPGFRAGIAAPFLPPCQPHGAAPGFVELPMTLADMHLPRRDCEQAARTVFTHLEKVKAAGGLAVLNWHIGHWHSDPAWREGYRRACEIVREDPDVWVATPLEVARWWLQRRSTLRRDD